MSIGSLPESPQARVGQSWPGPCVLFRARKRLLVDGKLLGGFLQFDGDFQIGLVDIVVLPVRAESLGNHLHPHFAVRNAATFGFAVLVGLEFQTFVLLFAFNNRVQHDLRILDRLTVGLTHHGDSQHRGLVLLLILGKCSERQEANHETGE